MTCADDHGYRMPAHVRPTMHDVELAMMMAFPLRTVVSRRTVPHTHNTRHGEDDVHPVDGEERLLVALDRGLAQPEEDEHHREREPT